MKWYFAPLLAVALIAASIQTALPVNSTTTAYTAKIATLLPKEARNNGKLGVVVKSLTSGETIYEHNAQSLFIPASNEKIITSVAALSLLKRDYRFRTEFYSGGGISKGVLHGGLYVKGYGDPTFGEPHLGFIVYQLKKRGVNEIKDGITVDDTYFSKTRRAEGWKDEWDDDFYSPPISALSFNYNTIEVKVTGTKSGQRPYVSILPEGSDITIINNAVTSSKKGGVLTTDWRDDQTIVVAGRVRSKASVLLKIPVQNPTILTGNMLKSALEEAGIKVSGPVVEGDVPRWATLFYTHYSDPLSTIITEYLKNSVNIIGENLIKTLAAEFRGVPGSWENGSSVISEFLNNIGIKDGFRVVDGSGLSLLNRVSPKTLTEVLSYAYENRIIASDFIDSLPIAGVDGTLKKRFRESDVQGRVMAKTGYLNNVRALSGYVFTKQGDVLVFSILDNGLGWKTKEFQSSLLSELVGCCGAGVAGNPTIN
ncbi:MAG TPA: D-alanyl-D-alanine carboxypeptidase/D-alanyl-D-alanine-endopeptidase [Thermodesulfobacteriota bacterium]|nr:D-alanyl-D-alanine carboxypeptidase/D-alanyl-D-alanine-endopeptidase [Thermodesulfobacteriota bacterium]